MKKGYPFALTGDNWLTSLKKIGTYKKMLLMVCFFEGKEGWD